MNDDFDPVVDAVLRRANAAVEPEPARLARALRAVQEHVVLGSKPGLEPSSNGVLREHATVPARVLSKAAAAPTRAVLRTPLAFLACSIVSAAIGFVFGMRYERTPVVAPPVVLPAPVAVATPAPALAGELLPAEPASAVAVQAPSLPVVVEAPRGKPSKSRAASPGPSFGFREVLSYVRRAERAERQGDPALALALLAELDERADANTLREERALTHVLALCAQGEREAAVRAQRELGAAKESIYAKRIAQSCVSETSASTPGETAP